MFIDLHTHHATQEPHTISITDCGITPDNSPACSIGIHPWRITPMWEKDMAYIREVACASNVAAIGECGIDKIHSLATIEVQKKVLTAHATLAEETQKPLILHCVKGQEEIIALHHEIAPEQAWIIHGFRGKPAQALQLIRAGLYLSFGDNYNQESLTAIPIKRILLESDISNTPISEIYKKVAKHLSLSVEELAATILQNIKDCNINII